MANLFSVLSFEQTVGYLATLFSYFAVGVPLAVILTFRAHMDTLGLCIGLATGCYVYMLSTGWIVWRINWKDEVGVARRRLSSTSFPVVSADSLSSSSSLSLDVVIGPSSSFPPSLGVVIPVDKVDESSRQRQGKEEEEEEQQQLQAPGATQQDAF